MRPELLLVISAPCHALWNLLVKRTTEKTTASAIVAVLSAVVIVVVGVFTGDLARVTAAGVPWMIGAGIAEGVYFAALARAYEQGTFGTAYTVMRGGAMLLVWGISTTVLGEPFTFITGCGVALILIGMALVNGVGRSGEHLSDAYISALCIAAYHLFYGRALFLGWHPIPLFAAAVSLGCMLFYCSCRKEILRGLDSVRASHKRAVIFGGLFCALSFLLFLLGLREVPPGEAISLRNLSVFFGVVYSLVLREPIRREQVAGMAGIAVGAVLVGR